MLMSLSVYWPAVALLAYAHSTTPGTFSSNDGSALPDLSTSADQNRSAMMDWNVNTKTKSPELSRSSSLVSAMVTLGTNQENIALCDEMVNFVKNSRYCHPNETPDASYSCKDRCGIQLSFDYSFDNCSCDLKCTVYQDCCIDFYSECSEVFARSNEIYRDGSKVLSRCNFLQTYKIITSCPSQAQGKLTPTVGPLTTSFTYDPDNPVYSGSGLARIVGENGVVVDITTGLAYQFHDLYLCNKREDSVPYFLPYVFPLLGEYVDGQSIESYVFPYSPEVYRDPYLSGDTSYLRACFRGETAYCSDCPSKTRSLYLNDLCMAQVFEEGITPDRYSSVYVNLIDEVLDQRGTCGRTPRPSSGMRYWSIYQQKFLKLSPQERPVPNLWMDARQMERLEQNIRGTVTITPLSSIIPKEYVLDFKGAPWKKMRCSIFKLRLDECDVLECSPGFFMTEDRKCFKPELVVVRLQSLMVVDNSSAITSVIPTCTCFIAYSSILAMDIWELGKIRTDDGHCNFPVKGTLPAQDLLRDASEQGKRKKNEENTKRTDLVGINGDLYVHPNGKENVGEFMRITSNDSGDQPGHWGTRYIHRLQVVLTTELRQRRDVCDDSYSKLFICFEKAQEVAPNITAEQGKTSICLSFTPEVLETSVDVQEDCSIKENGSACQSSKGGAIQLTAPRGLLLFALLLHVSINCFSSY